MTERPRETAADWSLWQDDTAVRDSVTPDAVRAAGRRLAHARTALGGRPDPGLDSLSWRWTFEASRTQRLVFLARCLYRVWPLAAAHPELGPFARAALPAGVEGCLGRPPADAALVLRVWTELAGTLDRLMPAGDPGDPSVGATGAGHAALVTAAVLRTLAEPHHPDAIDLCPAAAKDTSAAFAAVAPEPVRSRDAARVAQAVARDLDTLYHRDDSDAPTDPGEAGPYGRLWGREPFLLEIATLRAEVVALERSLTSSGESPTLPPMPTVDGPTTPQPNPSPDLAGLVPPGGGLTAAMALPELTALPGKVRCNHDSQVGRFREVLAALAGHKFDDRQTAARAIQALQEVRALLGVGFVLRSAEEARNGVRVSVVFDDIPKYTTGRFRAITTTKPQKTIYSQVAFPSLDVTDTSQSDSAER